MDIKWKKLLTGIYVMYEGEFIQIPFQAVFSEKTMPWLLDAAVVELEDRIDYIILNQKYEMNEGEQNGERKSVLFDA